MLKYRFMMSVICHKKDAARTYKDVYKIFRDNSKLVFGDRRGVCLRTTITVN